MASYSMTCSCGETMSVEAPTREDAVRMLQSGLTAEAISAHMAEHHKGEPLLSVDQVHAMIAANVK